MRIICIFVTILLCNFLPHVSWIVTIQSGAKLRRAMDTWLALCIPIVLVTLLAVAGARSQPEIARAMRQYRVLSQQVELS